MGVMVCTPGAGVWALDKGKHAVSIPCTFRWPCVPCASPEHAAFCCQYSRECLCVDRRTWSVVCRMPAAPGVCDMRFSPCGRYLYQLSSEADCIHALDAAAGELMFAAPAGVFPRCMKIGADGKMILCAGGALNEVTLMSAPDLKVLRRVETPHPCFAADFWKCGLALVCAAESGDIQTVLYTLAPGENHPHRLMTIPGPPGTVCVCTDQKTALLSTWNGLMKVDLRTGTILWNRAQHALCTRMECRGENVLVSGTVDGDISVLELCRGRESAVLDLFPESQACFL